MPGFSVPVTLPIALHDVEPVGHLAEDRVLARRRPGVELRRRGERHEELAAVRAGTAVREREHARRRRTSASATSRSSKAYPGPPEPSPSGSPPWITKSSHDAVEREPVVEALLRRGTRSCSRPRARCRAAARPRTCRTTSRSSPCTSPARRSSWAAGPTNCGVFPPASAGASPPHATVVGRLDYRRRPSPTGCPARPWALPMRVDRRRGAAACVPLVIAGQDHVPGDEQHDARDARRPHPA